MPNSTDPYSCIDLYFNINGKPRIRNRIPSNQYLASVRTNIIHCNVGDTIDTNGQVGYEYIDYSISSFTPYK